MYSNLRSELANKGITQVALANMLGVTEKTLQNKLNGKTEFTITESLYICHNVLPEFNLNYLFKKFERS